MKKIISKVILVMFVFYCIVQVSGLADSLPISVSPSGTGLQSDPYIITSGGNLVWIANNCSTYNGFSGTYFKQASDISLSGEWMPIGNNSVRFNGTYDGLGNKITGLTITTISSGQYLGLFGYVGSTGTVKNLSISSSIKNSNSGNSSYTYIGSIAGFNSGMISGCFSNGTISLTSNGNAFDGGVVGNNTGSITNCYDKSSVTSSNYYSSDGGISGANTGTISNCYSSGVYSGRSETGGITGSNEGKIANCCSIGYQSSANWAAPIAPNNNGLVSSCYFLYGSSPTCSNYSKSKIENCSQQIDLTFYKILATYTTNSNWNALYPWDFNNIWGLNLHVNNGYPYLISLNSTFIPTPTPTIAVVTPTATPVLTPTAIPTIAPTLTPTPDFSVTPSGSGTISDPYSIATEGNLIWISNNNSLCDGFRGKYFKQTTNVILSREWIPIGDNNNSFQGIYDGSGFEISGLTLSSAFTYQGLFGYIGNKSTINNLGVVVNINSLGMYTGGLAGLNVGTIQNCYCTGSVNSSKGYLGGLVGCNGNVIKSCYSTCTIVGNGNLTGGLIGINFGITKDCFATGSVNSSGSGSSGGLAGGNNGLIINCYEIGNVTGGSMCYVGGVAGVNGGKIRNCFATGSVGGGRYCYYGGLIGYNKESTLTNCHYVSEAGTNGVSSIVGGIIENCTLQTDLDYYKSSASFSDASWNSDFPWNFDGVWAVDSQINNGFPYLNAGYSPNELVEVNPILLSGSGTAVDPYLISNTTNLTWLSSNYKSYEGFRGKYFKQTSNITLNGEWNPIGDLNTSFAGNYDGGGFVIDGLSITVDNLSVLQGVFGFAGGDSSIHDLKISVNIEGNGDYIGGLAGWCSGEVSNCSVNGNLTTKNINTNIGGLVGYNVSNISKCSSICKLKGSNCIIGGLTGYNFGAISQSYSLGDIKGGKGYVGGLTGESGGSISNCYSACNVDNSDNNNSNYNSNLYIGGLIGGNFYGTIRNSFAVGSVNSNNSYSTIGELIGWNSGTISNCFATGEIVCPGGSNCTGGLLGYDYGSTIQNCYYVSTPGPQNASITKCTQQKIMSFYTSVSTYNTASNWSEGSPWDFINIWGINQRINSGYPYLLQNSAPAAVQISLPEFNGSGSLDDPYIISSGDNLIWLAENVSLYNGYLGVYFKQMNDISLRNGEWNPIGNISFPFNANYDGDGHSVKGLNITSTNTALNSGLFGVIGRMGMVKNLNMTVNFATGGSSSNVGGLAGINQGKVENCRTDGNLYYNSSKNTCVGGAIGYNKGGEISNSNSKCVLIGSVTAYGTAGGLVGKSDGNITNCLAESSICGGADYAGGFIGRNENTITNCHSTGAVTGTTYYTNVAGFVCLNTGTINKSACIGDIQGNRQSSGFVTINYGKIYNCNSKGKVKATGAGGGFVAVNYNVIDSCYSTSDVLSSNGSYIGGFVGENTNGIDVLYPGTGKISNCYCLGTVINNGGTYNYVGGFSGYNYNGSITNSYSTGYVQSSNNNSSIGGFVGYNYSSSAIIENCFTICSVGYFNSIYSVGGFAGKNEATITNCYYSFYLGLNGVGSISYNSICTGVRNTDSSFLKAQSNYTNASN